MRHDKKRTTQSTRTNDVYFLLQLINHRAARHIQTLLGQAL